MAERCLKCFRPLSHCLCEYAKPEIDSGIKFVFLMHPKEARKQRTGTGRLSRIALKDSEIIVGIDFSKNERFTALMNEPRFFPVLLYPGENALTVRQPEFSVRAGEKTLLVIIIDATWFCAKKIIQNNPQLLELPQLSFYGTYCSIFTFKREPKPEYISTIESCYYVIKELQSVCAEKNVRGGEHSLVKMDANPEPLMTVFKKMIKDQLQAENDRIEGRRPNVYAHDWKYTKTKSIPEIIK